jgi:hypothetical protein
MFDIWWNNLEQERQYTLEQDGQDGQDQLVQDQEPQELRYPSRERHLTAKAAALSIEY